MAHSHHVQMFKQKFFRSLFLAVPILFLAPMMGKTLPFQLSFPGSDWLVMILGTILFFYGGQPFLSGATDELKAKKPAMMTLISLGLIVSYVYSMYAFLMTTILKSDVMIMDFFWELASLIIIMLLGHWIEMKAVGNAGNALHEMAALLPNDAILLKNNDTVTVPINQVTVGQQVIVSAGENIPVDGDIISGETTVNEAFITGEAIDVPKKEGDKVIGGSTNGNGTITVLVTQVGEDGYLSQVMALVEQAQSEQSKSETLSNKVAGWLFYIALVVGIIAFISWFYITKDLNIALERLVTVLIIACPHALGLAIPLVVARSTSIGAKNGLLVKDRQALEIAQKVTVVFMDKTGTLTEGDFTVTDVTSFVPFSTDNDILRIAAALETHSTHPLAKGIVDYAYQRGIEPLIATNVTTIPGTGLAGIVDQHHYQIVNRAYLEQHQLAYDQDNFNDLSQHGYSISYLISGTDILGVISLGDKIKPHAKEMIDYLKKENMLPVMLTGDNQASGHAVAQFLGIETVHAELMPEDKEQIIADYHRKGYVSLMVGDGINDAPSLARANIGIAIGAGTDVAIDSAEIILTKSNPNDMIHFFQLAKQTTRKMVQNLWWGAGYNILAIPLAAGVLAPIEILLSPAFGSVLMSLSTVIVAINAMLLSIED